MFFALVTLVGLAVGAHVAVLQMIRLLGAAAPAESRWWTPFDLVAFSGRVGWTDWLVLLGSWGAGLTATLAVVGATTGALLAMLRPAPGLDSHGTARWATRRDIVCAGLLDGHTNGASLIVGGWQEPKRRGPVEFLVHTGPEALILFAPSRSGKSVGIVVPNLLCYESSVFVLDVKGELWELTAGHRRSAFGQQVLYHDPSREDMTGARFNPLAEIDMERETAVRDVQMLMQYLIPSEGKTDAEGINSHFTASARSLAVGIFLYEMARAVLAAPGGTTTITAVLSAVTRPDRRIKDYLEELARFEAGHPDVASVIRETAAEMLQREEREFSGVLSSLVTPLTTFRDPILARATSASDFRISDLVSGEAPLSLYLTIRPSDRDRLKNYFALLVNLVCRKLTDRLPEPGETRHELLLMLDEFSSLPPLPVVQQSMDQMPGYGIKAFIVLQDVETLQALYGEHETISSNVRIQIAYTPSKPKTAKFLSEATGTATVLQESSSESRKPGGLMPSSCSESEGFHQRALMTPDEVMRLGTVQVDEHYRMVTPGEALIFARGCYPIRAMQTPFFMHPELADRAKCPPPPTSDLPREAPALTITPALVLDLDATGLVDDEDENEDEHDAEDAELGFEAEAAARA